MLLLAIAACVGLTGLRWTRLGRGLGPRPPRRRLGRRVRDRRRAGLPRHHELERGARPLVGAVRGLAGRPRRLGRDPLRLPRRRVRHPPRRARASACSPTRSRPACWSPRGSAAGATGSTRSSTGSRPTCPGASRSTSGTGRRSTSPRTHLPPDLPLRVHLRPRDGRRADPDRVAVPDQAAGPVRALRRLLHLRAHASRSCSGSTRRTTSSASG